MVVAIAKGSHGEQYKIEKLAVNDWTCSCKSFQFTKAGKNGKKFPCKHQRNLWTAWHQQVLPVGIQILNAEALGR